MPDTLDEQSRDFLELGNAQPGPKLEEMSVADARQALRETMRTCDIEKAEVANFETVAIDGPDCPIRLRIYHPAEQVNAMAPILILYHGGGWFFADLDDYDAMARYFCRHSAAIVVSVEYRLAPEFKFPAGLDDCYGALCWVSENADKLGGDPDRIAVIGDSAGGNYAAVVCQLARDSGGPEIARQVLLYPVLAVDDGAATYPSRQRFGGGDFFISESSIRWTAELYLDRPELAEDTRVSPLLAADLSHLPPALIVTAGHDPLRDEGQAYAERLRQSGVPTDYKCFETTIHGFMTFGAVLDVGRQALAFVSDWLRNNLDHPAEHSSSGA